MPVGTDCLRRLEQMLKLVERNIGVRIIDERVEKIERIKDAHTAAIEAEILVALPADELKCLIQVILLVELSHGFARGIVIIPIVCGRLFTGLWINVFFNEV